MYISIDGADGVGKSLIIKLLSESLPEKIRGYDMELVVTNQPGDKTSETCKMLRTLCLSPEYEMATLTNELLFLADLHENITRTVRPALLRGDLIISDRGLLTHYAYAFAKDILTPWLAQAYMFVSDDVIPDITFIITREKGPTSAVLKSKVPDKMEMEGDKFQEKVKRFYELALTEASCGKFYISFTLHQYTNIYGVKNIEDEPMVAVDVIKRTILGAIEHGC